MYYASHKARESGFPSGIQFERSLLRSNTRLLRQTALVNKGISFLHVYMARTKAQKGEIIAKVEDSLKNGASSVFVHFSKLSVADETEMRRALRAEGVSYFVAKKSLIRRALESLGHKHEEIALDGELAIASGGGDDVTVAARIVHSFTEKLSDKLSILGGIFEGKLVDAMHMKEIATIPSMDSLRGMFAQVLNSPRSRFAIVLSKVAETKN